MGAGIVSLRRSSDKRLIFILLHLPQPVDVHPSILVAIPQVVDQEMLIPIDQRKLLVGKSASPDEREEHRPERGSFILPVVGVGWEVESPRSVVGGSVEVRRIPELGLVLKVNPAVTRGPEDQSINELKVPKVEGIESEREKTEAGNE